MEDTIENNTIKEIDLLGIRVMQGVLFPNKF